MLTGCGSLSAYLHAEFSPLHHTHTYTNIHTYVYIHIHTNTYVNTNTHTYIYIHTFTHTWISMHFFQSMWIFLTVTSEYFLDLISHDREPLGASFHLDADELQGPSPVKKSWEGLHRVSEGNSWRLQGREGGTASSALRIPSCLLTNPSVGTKWFFLQDHSYKVASCLIKSTAASLRLSSKVVSIEKTQTPSVNTNHL